VVEIAFSRNGHSKTTTLSDLDAALLAEGISDEGNARCTNQLHASHFLHTDALGWLRYTGTHWTARGASAAVSRAIVDTLSRRIQAAINTGEPEKNTNGSSSFAFPTRAGCREPCTYSKAWYMPTSTTSIPNPTCSTAKTAC